MCCQFCNYDYDAMHALYVPLTWSMNMRLFVSERPSKALRGSIPTDPPWCPLWKGRMLKAERALRLTHLNAPLVHQTAQQIT